MGENAVDLLLSCSPSRSAVQSVQLRFGGAQVDFNMFKQNDLSTR